MCCLMLLHDCYLCSHLLRCTFALVVQMPRQSREGRPDVPVQALVVEFREAFVEAVRPRALPSTWNVHHDLPREFGPHSIFQVGAAGGNAPEVSNENVAPKEDVS